MRPGFSRLAADLDPNTVALFLAIGVIAGLMPAQSDTWWLLRAGEEMWRTGRILLHDEFTHTVTGQDRPNHEWLAQVMFYGLYRTGGLPLLTAFCAGAVVVTWMLVFTLTDGPIGRRLLLVGVGAALSTATWSLRPQTVSLAFFAATLWVVLRRRYVWLLPALFLVWANLHGAVATGGLLLVAAAAASLVRDRAALPRLVAIGILCVIAISATPLGLSFWLEIPGSLVRLKTYGVLEWRAPALSNPSDLPFWLVVAALIGLIVQQRHQPRSWTALTLLVSTAFTLALALRSTRNVATFLICATPLAAVLLARPAASAAAPPARQRASGSTAFLLAVSIAAVGVVGWAWSAPLARLGWQPMPEQMRQAISDCHGPLYNRYDEGGYIIWFLKGRPVFIDSRQDPFPEEMVLDSIRLEATGDYQGTFRRYAIRCALTPEGSPLAARLRESRWREQPAGPGWSVMAKPTAESR